MTGSKKGRKIHKPTNAQRRLILEKMEIALARGVPEEQIVTEFAETEGLSTRTTHRYLHEHVLSRIATRARWNRSKVVARQNLKLEHAQRLALNQTKHVTMAQIVGEGDAARTLHETRPVPAADLASYARLLEVQHKLLGVNAPTQHEVMVRNMDSALRRIVGIVRSYVRNREDRRRLIQELKEAAMQDLSRRRAILDGDAGEIIDVDAGDVKTLPAPGHNGNGAAGGG